MHLPLVQLGAGDHQHRLQRRKLKRRRRVRLRVLERVRRRRQRRRPTAVSVAARPGGRSAYGQNSAVGRARRGCGRAVSAPHVRAGPVGVCALHAVSLLAHHGPAQDDVEVAVHLGSHGGRLGCSHTYVCMYYICIYICVCVSLLAHHGPAEDDVEVAVYL